MPRDRAVPLQGSGLPDPAKRTLRCGPWEDRPDGSSVCQKCGRVDLDLDLDDGDEPMDYTPMVPLSVAEKLAAALEAWCPGSKVAAEFRASHPRPAGEHREEGQP